MALNDRQSGHWRYNLRQILGLTAAVAFVVAAAAAMPNRYGSISLLLITLILPGVLLTIAITGSEQAKIFCLAATIPIAFALYVVGWALGWTVFGSSSPTQLVAWFDDYGGAVTTTVLSAWICGGISGILCVWIRRRLQR